MSAPGAEWISDRSRENSPEGHGGSSQQRASKKRKVLSCYACRSRKMKCDRVYPVCGRCQKTGRADQCTYDPRLLDEAPANGSTHAHGAPSFTLAERLADTNPSADAADALRWKVRTQEQRIAMLEQKLAAKNTARNPSQYDDVVPEEPEIKEEMMFRGKGFKTQFHGVTSVMSMISRVGQRSKIAVSTRYHELQTFTREALTVDHPIMRVKNDFKTFRDRRKNFEKEQGAMTCGTDSEMLAALPERSVVDVQVSLYFQTWETTYRILHEPSFWKEYRAFWEQGPGDKDRVSFAVMLVLIIAITKCLAPKDDVFVGDTTADRKAASDLIHICEAWIAQQPRKRLTLMVFQLQCLALLAKRVNCIKMKQDWVASGDLLRLALASGMHRDPSLLGDGRISTFDQEMKKRLWVTIMELELQSSVESGLQSGLTGLYFDTPAPANLADEDLSVDTQQVRTTQGSDHFTSASYLVATLRSLPLRIRLTQLLNTPSSDLQYADILHFDAQIHSAISALPSWDNERAAAPSALLALQLRQYLLILHKPYAKLAPIDGRYMYSFTIVVGTCSSIIEIHDKLVSKGDLTLGNLRNDVIRLGLTLSQVVYENCTRHAVKSSAPLSANSETQYADPQSHFAEVDLNKRWGPPKDTLYLAEFPRESFLARTLCISSLEILERTRQNFEQKVFRLGTGYMEYWLLSAAIGMLPSSPSPATSIAYINNASDDILSRCKKTLDCFTTLTFRVLALQRDADNSLASSLRNTMASVSPSDGRTSSMTAGVFGAGSQLDASATQSSFIPLKSMGLGETTADGVNGMAGPYDPLQDMQIDMSGWAFPDFWAFDLGGDF
ncbi:C6 zinc finger domain-containing protein [Decorospora gaudefroyi]|uniref:C6 zinc finger domain-containing protein n=1 Tax=Decorospora gaudefroyi TaxID=184978 RepID=A0A6A5KI20_9PLEO|nr:C6 zinc finger domain-containing protein [Decorospora gaudefroyi]